MTDRVQALREALATHDALGRGSQQTHYVGCEKEYHWSCAVRVLLAALDAERAERDALKAALRLIADCDWVISLPDRMDAVRDLARAALASPRREP